MRVPLKTREGVAQAPMDPGHPVAAAAVRGALAA